MKAGDPWARPRNDEAMAMSRSEAADLILLTKSSAINRKIRKIRFVRVAKARRRYYRAEIEINLFDFMQLSSQSGYGRSGI